MESLAEYKKCIRCSETKPLVAFKYTSGYGDKHTKQCKKCLSPGNPKNYASWDIEKIREGIEKFNQEYGHYPSISGFEAVDYLPSPSTISVKYGGIEHLRKELGYSKSHFGKGKDRSKIATDSGKRGLELENKIEKILIDRFKEPYVHSQKRFMDDNLKFNVDFFVYSPSVNFAVDSFSSTPHYTDVVNNINHKIRRYKFFKYLFIIVFESEVSQKQIDSWMKRKILPLPNNFKVLKLDKFISWINSLEFYPDLPK
jgi:hypothetical protein